MQRQLLIALSVGLLATAAQAADRQALLSDSTATVTFAQMSRPNLWRHSYVNEAAAPLGRTWLAFHGRNGWNSIAAVGSFAAASSGAHSNGLHLGNSGAANGLAGITYSGYARQFNSGNSGNHFNALTPAVPEPSTYALMACGLLAVGAVARRRKNK